MEDETYKGTADFKKDDGSGIAHFEIEATLASSASGQPKGADDSKKDDRFKSAGDALKKLNAEYDYWSGTLSDYSYKISFAVIAANWAVHGSANAIISNSFSKLSMITVFVFLCLLLIVSFILIRLHSRQFRYGDEDTDRWEREFLTAKDSRYWPYTKAIHFFGKGLQYVKLILPLAAAAFFIISVF